MEVFKLLRPKTGSNRHPVTGASSKGILTKKYPTNSASGSQVKR